MGISLTDLRQNLEEKLLILGNNKNYGQVLFLAGGAGSGKGFALSNVIGMGSGFKIIDSDAFKGSFLKWKNAFATDPDIAKYCEKDGVPTPSKPCMRDPAVTSKLHSILMKLGWEDRTVQMLLDIKGKRNPDTLPNIVFDRTLKTTDSFTHILPALKIAGYKPENIHIVWVLSDYRIAIKQNLGRTRTVPTEVLFHTHEGAAKTMLSLAKDSYPDRSLINGDVWTIVGRANRITSDTGGSYIAQPDASDVNALKFIRLKKSGGSFDNPNTVWSKIGCHICKNTPLEDTDVCKERNLNCR